MKTTALDNVYTWGAWQPERRIDFNGFFLARPDGNVLVDPMPMPTDVLECAEGLGGAAWILLTNFDHLRATAELKERLGARVAAPAEERERFGEAAALVDGWYRDEADLPDGMAGELQVHLLRGGKSPVEAALYLRAQRALLFGDLVRSHVSGRLRLLPGEKIADAGQVEAGLRELAGLEVDAILLGDGDSIFRGGREALDELLGEIAG